MNISERPVPYSVYIHLPFCRSKCRYCDFNSVATQQIPFENYTQGIHREWALRKELVQGGKLKSVYVGGGTPSLWPSKQLASILKLFDVSSNVEVTVEINPGEASLGWLCEMVRAGVNRFSIGAQSLVDDHLSWLGRRHDANDVISAVHRAKAAGADSLSVDMIYGLPGQSPSSLAKELEAFSTLGADHISAYELTVAKGTPLHNAVRSGETHMPENELAAELWREVGSTLSRFGYERYEVSSYARGGNLSRHNSHYWSGGFYVGLGAGAHGFVENRSGEMGRYANIGSVSDYLQFDSDDLTRYPESGAAMDSSCRAGALAFERVDALTHAREKIMLGLRTVAGIDIQKLISALPTHTQSKWLDLQKVAASDGFIRIDGNRILPTERGMLMADEVAMGFF